jgi:hypothetical protein
MKNRGSDRKFKATLKNLFRLIHGLQKVTR